MPQMGGAQLVENLRAALPNLTVLLVSGYTDNVMAQQSAVETGKIFFLQKPFSAASLASKVREVLDRASKGS